MKNNVVTIKRNKEIVNIIGRHQAYDNITFKFKITFNKLSQLRYVLAVNKKNFKTAVLRNKIKRELRTFIQAIQDIKFVDWIIIVKSNYIHNTKETNKKLFLELYNQIRNL